MIKKIVTTLIPIFFLFIFLNFVNSENNKIYYPEYYPEGRTFSAGSTVLIHYYNYDHDITIPIGKVYMHYELIDAEGKTVYKWIKEPRWYYYSATTQYAEDYFEFQIPLMMSMIIFEERPEGEWTLIASVHDEAGDVDFSSIIEYKFEVVKGHFIDNLFAPIYIYRGYKVFGLEIANFHGELPPIGFLLIPIIIVILIIFIIRYIRFVYKTGKKFISLSSIKINEGWRTGEENVRK